MHTGIVFAVEADSAEEAVRRVEVSIYEENFAEWSDWSEHSGRWSDVVENGVLCYKDNPEKFDEVVDGFRKITEQVLIETVKDYGHLTLDELIGDPRYCLNIDNDEFTEETHRKRAEGELVDERTDEEKKRDIKDSLAVYHAKRALKLVEGQFGPDAHFYDMSADSLSRKWLDGRIKKDPKKQYLVVWDFHF